MTIRLAALAACALLVAGCSPQPQSTEEEEAAVTAQPQALTADHIANLIAADGARHTVLVLTGPADPTGFDKVLQGIATGAPEWLALVPAIQPATDGMYAEGLQDALATALTLNAPGVLALMPSNAAPVFVCTATTPPDARTIAARAALQAVEDPALQARKERCLAYMDADEAQLAALEAE